MDDSQFFYRVGSYRTFNKIRALEHANGDPSKVQWYCMDDIWQAAQCSIEPQHSWQELLKANCQRLRDSYSYLALWYSGGYDSHTALMSFLRAGIPLDELYIQDKRHLLDDQEYQVGIETANWVKTHHWPNLKINVVKIDINENVNFYLREGDQWIYGEDTRGHFAKWSPYLRKHATYHLTYTLRNSGYTQIVGMEKPRITLHENKWYMYFPDTIAQDVVNSDHENFYLTAHMPEIHIKQTWMMIRWMESLNNIDEDLVHRVQMKDLNDPIFHGLYRDWNLAIGREIRSAEEDYIHWQAKLGGLGLYAENLRSKRLFEHVRHSNPVATDIYLRGCKYLKRIKGDHAPICGQKWFIKDFEPRNLCT